MVRRLLDRALAAIARITLLGFFRTLEVEGAEHVPPAGTPVLVVANHFNGLVDPVAIVRALGRMPRFLAKSTLWKSPAARPFLALAGLIPVYRSIDAQDTARNVEAFRAAHEVLARGATVAMFPEGISHDATRLAELRTGAARIALGARAAGIHGVRILPIGLVFESKLALRSRLLIRIGSPVDLDDVVESLAAPAAEPAVDRDHEVVRQLTAIVRERLAAVTPDYASHRERSDLALAAEIALREAGPDRDGIRLSDRERLAQRLAHQPDVVRTRLRTALGDYLLELRAVGLEDDELVATFSKRRLLLRLLVTGAAIALVATFALVGLTVNVLPYLVVTSASRRVKQPVSKGSVRFLTAVVVFPLAWFGVAGQMVDGWWRVLLLGMGYALAGLLVVRVLEATFSLVADYHSWQSVRERQALLPDARVTRGALVAEILKAAG